MQLAPRQIIEPNHLYCMEIDSFYITVKHLCLICNNSKLVYCQNKVIDYNCVCMISPHLSLKTLKIQLLKLQPLKFRKTWKNITNKIQKQVLLNQQYISRNLRSYFDKYRDNDIIDNHINSYCQSRQNCQKNNRLVTCQNINYGIGILVIGKVPLCHPHTNLGRNILPKLVPKICQRIKTIINGTVGLTPG